MSNNDEVGSKPEPEIEEAERYPGGVDAVEGDEENGEPMPPRTPDLSPDDNPAVNDVVPDEVSHQDTEKMETDEASEQTQSQPGAPETDSTAP